MKNYSILSTITLILIWGSSATISAQNTCASPTIIPGIPFSSGNLSTCGTGDEYPAGTYCDPFYGDGEDFVYQLNITNAPVTYTFVLSGATAGKIMSVHSACPPSSGNCIANITTGNTNIGYSNITFPNNGTYYIIIDTGLFPDCGQFSLNITELLGIAPNDLCSNALILAAGPQCIPTIGTTNGATDSNQPTDCMNNNVQNTVWYQFEATSTTHLVIVQGVYQFDAVIGANKNCNNASRPHGGGCTDETDGGGVETMLLTDLTIGDIYYIQVFDYEGDATPTSLFTICVTLPPDNDVCENATDLGLFPVVITGSNIGASDEGIIDRASCDNTGIADINDVWYQFTTTTGGDVTIIFSANTFDGVLSAYSDCSTTGEIDCADSYTIGLPEILNLSGLLPNTTYYIRIYNFNPDQGSFNLAISGTALPIELKSFTGRALEKTNLLTWTTSSEKNVAWHIVERSAAGTDSWSETGRKMGHQDSRSELNYTIEDILPLPNAYYRVRTVDLDGKEQISGAISIVRPNSHLGISAVSPNPATERLNITVNNAEENVTALQVFDLAGRLASEQQVNAEKGVNIYTMDISRLSAGVYFIKVSGGNAISEMVRFVKI